VTQTEHRHAAEVPRESSEAIDWLRRNAVTLAGLALIAIQVWWKGTILAHFFFRQDDFRYFDRALASPFSWGYLMSIDGGHLLPGDFAYVWVLARISVYDWTLASAVTILLLAASGLAMLRLLRTLFGSRPAILIPLAVGLFTPLTLSALAFWGDTLDYLPLQLAFFLAVNAHVVYVRTGRFRHAVAAAAWLVAGLAAGAEGLVVPLVLFALTSGFLMSGPWQASALESLRRFWRAWVLYGVLSLAYLVIFVVQLSTAHQRPTKPGLFSGVVTFAWELVRDSFIPAALGGPLKWYSIGNFAFADPSPWVARASWAVAAIVVLASLWFRRHAWRSWAILVGWILIADIIPVVIGRVSTQDPTFLGLDLHYLADSVQVLVICLGLAFWPVVGEENAYRARRRGPVLRYAMVYILMAAFLAGSVWSGHTLVRDTTSAPQRSYIDTATAAMRDVQSGIVIVSQPVPAQLMQSQLFGTWGYTQAVMTPLVPHGKKVAWTLSPAGVIPHLMLFDYLGRLRNVVVQGPSSPPPPVRHRHRRALTSAACWPIRSTSATRIPVDGKLYRWVWTALVNYSGPATILQLRFGAAAFKVAVPAGHHEVYLPANGGGTFVTMRSLTPAPGACVAGLTVGSVEPSVLTHPVPDVPLP
jgi:hypothetical protein